ncbi:MAG: phosphomannose isomerase type II C-terminal cupin domain [Patescibacteria group bacterium]
MNEDIRKDIYEEKRPWGSFRKFTQNVSTTVKIIEILPGESLSLQTHRHRGEFWRIIGGNGIVEINGKRTEAVKGGEFFIPTQATHRAIGGNETLEILEIATGDFDEADIERLEDKYGRIA